MPDTDLVEADCGSDVLCGGLIAFRADEVVPGDVGVAGIKAHAHRRAGFESGDEFGYLLEAATERELSPGGVLDEDAKAGSLPRQVTDGALNVFGGEAQPLLPGEALPGARVQNEVGRAQRERTADLVAKGARRVGAHRFRLRA